jgi:Complex I intermediate-associated protein 30 (CIA30)
MISRLLLFSFSTARFCSGGNMNIQPEIEILGAGSVIYSASSTTVDLGWYALDDVVMGGASKSNLNPGTKFDGVWTGYVTTAQNGGFAGIRTKPLSPIKDASSSLGFVLDLKGDGQRYKFIARDSLDWSGIAWSTSFDTTPNEQMQVKIPWDKLIPTMRARTVVSEPFNKKRITAVQLTLSKFEYDGGISPSFKEGPFRLELNQISLF